MIDFKGKRILITGGTGSFGQKFASHILNTIPEIGELIIFSRDEFKQYQMVQTYPSASHPITYVLGDIRDYNRLTEVFRGVDYVIHAAALKHVPIAEYNPSEFIKTNIIGTENIIKASIECKVKKVIALSSDKAVSPAGLYGASKLCADKLIVAANYHTIKNDPVFSIVRYGNMLASRGSVIPHFLKEKETGSITITNPDMTRFSTTNNEEIHLIFKALNHAEGGEIFVPKLPSYKITAVAKAVAPTCTINISGIRPGEKLYEELISASDAPFTIEFNNYFMIHPLQPKWNIEERMKKEEGKLVASNFEYRSDKNTEWLTVERLDSLIREIPNNILS